MSKEEGTWIKVRTDLFDPVVYLELELYFKEFIEKIYEFGGYITFSQFERLYGKTHRPGHNQLRRLIDKLNLLGEHQVNNNKYAYLKTRSMQYIKKNIKAKSMAPRPNNHVLMTSIYKAEYYLKYNVILKTEVTAANFTKLQDQIRVKFGIDAPFANPEAFLEEINRLHYSRCFLVRTRSEDKAIHINYAVIDYDRSKTWFLNLLKRLDNIIDTLNTNCSYTLEILAKNKDREIAVKRLCNNLLKDNEKRKQIRERMLNSNTPTGQVRVHQMDNLIFNYCKDLSVANLDINRFFIHSSNSQAQVLKIAEIDQLKVIKKEILNKQGN